MVLFALLRRLRSRHGTPSRVRRVIAHGALPQSNLTASWEDISIGFLAQPTWMILG